jgi:hypothetical protein
MGEIVLSQTPGGTNSQPVFVSKTITFTGAANLGAVGPVPIFTLTGQVLVKRITGYTLTNCAGATATISLGVTGSTALFIGATTATGMLTTAAWWVSTTPTATAIALPAGVQNFLIEANIIGTVATAAITAGVVRIDVEYIPLSAGASLA